VFVALLGSSLLVTWLADGRASVRKLLSRVVLWRFSAWRWAIILFAVPVLTVALAAASGDAAPPRASSGARNVVDGSPKPADGEKKKQIMIQS
jgi:hypothetical protein